MKTITHREMDPQQWADWVRESKTGTWFQTPQAFAFYQSLPQVFEPFAFAVQADNRLRAVCVGFVTKEGNRIQQFFTRRAIIDGGPALANDTTEEEVSLLMTAVRDYLQQKAIYIETRNFHDFTPWRNAFEKVGFAYREHLNFHFDCADKQALWEHLSATRRKQIKKALGAQVQIVEPESEDDIHAWYEILRNLYRTRVKTPLWPEQLFRTFYRDRVGQYLLVKQNGEVIGGMMCPVLDGKCIYEWFICGRDADCKEAYPSVMATWAALEYANEHHLPKFDIMGAGVPGVPYGVRDFKAEFGGHQVEHGRFLFIHHPFLYRLGEIGVKMLKSKIV